MTIGFHILFNGLVLNGGFLFSSFFVFFSFSFAEYFYQNE
jgi:hypothetical protein